MSQAKAYNSQMHYLECSHVTELKLRGCASLNMKMHSYVNVSSTHIKEETLKDITLAAHIHTIANDCF